MVVFFYKLSDVVLFMESQCMGGNQWMTRLKMKEYCRFGPLRCLEESVLDSASCSESEEELQSFFLFDVISLRYVQQTNS
jgi:hypothetical protein